MRQKGSLAGDPEKGIRKRKESDIIVALAGNPNVGKSTVFNAMTGLKQHTGNWPGKTVAGAVGYCVRNGQGYVMVDLPGCYSLRAHSKEEEVAGDFIRSGAADVVVVVCDAVCLERNLNLTLQIMDEMPRVILCVNLMDEAAKKQIHIDLGILREQLKAPVIGIVAREGKGLEALYPAIKAEAFKGKEEKKAQASGRKTEEKVAEASGPKKEEKAVKTSGRKTEEEASRENGQRKEKKAAHRTPEAYVKRAEEICRSVLRFGDAAYAEGDRRKDRIFTGKYTAFPIMFLLLLFIFWLTAVGANYPSGLLRKGLFYLEEVLMGFCIRAGLPEAIREMLIHGVYRVMAWVVSVMLPPMAIFFPLFTVLEDSGYLPRVAFNLDRCFKKCRACGKQALTMCMGFGCNAVGVTGCRIIDSPRERLLAILTNSLVPCNGRFPTLLAIITMFFAGGVSGGRASFLAAALVAGCIVLGVGMTLLTSRILSATVLKGTPSAFVLELPPYRRPQVGKVIVRSVFDRTLFVLGRAAMAAAPAGLLIWLAANVQVGDQTLLSLLSLSLDPFARLLGLDGTILLAFILGFPANEIVVPILIMGYLAQGNLSEIQDLSLLRQLLVQNGWTWVTAISAMLFSLMHWPCATTCLTVHKETGSLKWTTLSILVPTVAGVSVCLLFNAAVRLLCL